MQLRRYGFLLKVKAEHLETYKAHHQQVWSEMLDALRQSGWRNYSLFLAPDGQLFGYFESPYSLEECQRRMAQQEVNERWQTLMAPFFDIPKGAKPDTAFTELESIFYLP